jgi:hypothetical protein
MKQTVTQTSIINKRPFSGKFIKPQSDEPPLTQKLTKPIIQRAPIPLLILSPVMRSIMPLGLLP